MQTSVAAALLLISTVLVSCVFVGSRADITGTSPSNGACLCVTASELNLRNSACGAVSGQLSSGQCQRYAGAKQRCSLSGTSYEFFKLQNGKWSAGIYLRAGSASECGSPTPTPAGGCPRIVSRGEWGARAATSYITISRPIPRVFIHHTESAGCTSQSSCSAAVKSIQNYHIDSKGWADIGYNFLVGEDGNVYEGRGWDRVGAHALRYNPTGLGISMIGSFDSRLPNSAALNAVQRLISCGVSLGKISGSYALHGHRDGVCTDCPGDALYNRIRSWPRFAGQLSVRDGC
jgi:N-acetylmuramoyl-L-alanine amidase